MSGFEWGDDIMAAKLSTGQVKQVLSCSQELIAGLDQRRIWSRCVINMYPTLPTILRPVIYSEHFFRKFRREFVLKHQPKRDVWRLCFIAMTLESEPDGDDDIDVVATETTSPDAGRVMREKRGPSSEIHPRITALLNEATTRLGRWKASRELADVYNAAREPFVALSGVIQETRVAYFAAKQALLERRDDIIASIARWQDEIAEAAVQDSFADGRFERRTIKLAGGVTVSVNTIVYERTDWDSLPFGRRIDEDLLLD